MVPQGNTCPHESSVRPQPKTLVVLVTPPDPVVSVHTHYTKQLLHLAIFYFCVLKIFVIDCAHAEISSNIIYAKCSHQIG